MSASNKYIKEQIDLIEEDSDTESDSDYIKQPTKAEIEKIVRELKCDKCDFIAKTLVTLKKHVNTKHPHLVTEHKYQEEDIVLNCVQELFQIEALEGEQVFACNVCNEGFDIEDNVRKHITSDHTDILMQISKDINEEK